ncbi:MAG: TonB-dependent receptor, partial [Bacteroidetes bacterium]|nr:TonB-dependent receptor [Bacteroidota bacterium]
MKKIILLSILLIVYLNVHAQYSLRGTIRDIQNNLPIPSAIVTIPGTEIHTSTDDEGLFELKSSSAITTISIRAIGYEQKEITVSDYKNEILITLQPTNLSTGEIQVESNMKRNIETPQSIGHLSKEDLNRDIGINFQNTMNLLPGVRMQFRNLGSGVLMSIRGYGVQTNFNGNGYKAYYNDISLTDADGTTALDEVDYTNLGNVEVYKGPSSSIYGANIAGTLIMKTDKAPWGTNIVLGGLGGSFGLFRTNTGISVGSEKLNLFVNYGHQQADGFRQHNNTQEDFAIVNGTVYIDSKNTFSFFGNYSNVYNALAGEQDSLTFLNNPTLADTQYVNNDAHIRSESSRIGFSFEHLFSKVFKNKTTIYAGFFFQDQPSAAGLTRANKTKLGGRTTFSYSPVIGTVPANFTFGGEFLQNLNFQKSYGLVDSKLGALRGDQEIKPMTYNMFGQVDLDITKTTLFTAGASLNFVEYSVTDMMAGTPTHVNMTGYRKFDPIVTPRVAINQIIKGLFSVYASVSTGFTPPSTSQVLITQLGKVNLDLKSETAVSYEIGTKGDLFDKKLSYEIAGYLMNVSNKLVTQNFVASGSTPAYSITTNAGEVRYKGIEGKVSYAYLPANSNIISLVRPFVTYTYTDNKNVDFKSDNNNNANTKDYSGLVVPGVAPNVLNFGLDVFSKQGLYLNMTYSWTDEIYTTFNNQHAAPSYSLLNSRLGYKRNIANMFNL